MKLAREGRNERGGFTLIELLVVMLIIVALAGLITAAAFRALGKGDEVKLRNEISQLSLALQNFKTKYGFYPPSRLKLCKRYSDYGTNQLDKDSIFYLTQIAARIADNTALPPSDPNYAPGRTKSPWMATSTSGLTANLDYIDWDQSGTYTTGTPGSPIYILEGDQCLVFFLGGMHSPSTGGGPFTMTGFSASVYNPADTGSGSRVAPFYDFVPDRLKNDLGHGYNLSVSGPALFLYYVDPFGSQPFAYFSSYKTANGYNRYYGEASPTVGISDCQSMVTYPANVSPPPAGEPTIPSPPPASWPGLWPYTSSSSSTASLGPPSATYMNPNSYQLVSAGPDKKWGCGYPFVGPSVTSPTMPPTAPVVAWWPALAWTSGTAGDQPGYGLHEPGYDDMSSFHEAPLGVAITPAGNK